MKPICFFSNLKFARNFAEQKSWKSICYFFNFEFACYFTFLEQLKAHLLF